MSQEVLPENSQSKNVWEPARASNPSSVSGRAASGLELRHFTIRVKTTVNSSYVSLTSLTTLLQCILKLITVASQRTSKQISLSWTGSTIWTNISSLDHLDLDLHNHSGPFHHHSCWSSSLRNNPQDAHQQACVCCWHDATDQARWVSWWSKPGGPQKSWSDEVSYQPAQHNYICCLSMLTLNRRDLEYFMDVMEEIGQKVSLTQLQTRRYQMLYGCNFHLQHD